MTVMNLRLRQPVGEHEMRVDRSTKWGNPFVMGKHGDREQVISMYREHLWKQIQEGEVTVDELASMAGMNLYCWCAPKPCHANVIEQAAYWALNRLEGS